MNRAMNYPLLRNDPYFVSFCGNVGFAVRKKLQLDSIIRNYIVYFKYALPNTNLNKNFLCCRLYYRIRIV